MRASTALMLAGLGVASYLLWKRERVSSGTAGSNPGAIEGWTDADLPPSLRALPEGERRLAGDAYFSRDPVRASVAAGDLHHKGYHEAAGVLDLRATLYAAAATGEGRFPTSSRA